MSTELSKGRASLIALSLSLSSAPPVYAQVADTSIRAAVAPEPRGRLVDIGGRRLHLYCTGKGAPTTILLSGASAFSLDWYPVQRELSKASRVCSYDRAGLAWSDPGPRPHTEAQALLDLHTLLSKAKEGGPFLLVGHSLGGHLARLYAARYPREVADILILDSRVETTLQNVNGRFVRGTDAALPRAVPSPRLTLADSERDLTPAEQQGVAQFRKFVGPPTIDETYAKLPPEIQRLRLWAMSQPSSVVADFNAYGGEEAVLSLADRIHNPEQLRAATDRDWPHAGHASGEHQSRLG
jgi:pimeloyl-ACP methyl ester carboxylesterase